MDRNLFSAIILTTLVVVFFYSPLYQKRFGHPDARPAVEQTALPDTTSAPAASAVDSAAKTPATMAASAPETASPAVSDTTGRVPLQINPPEEKLITLANADIRLVIDTRGGTITEAMMTRYTGVTKDSLVQLVSPGQTWFDGAVTDAAGTIAFRDIVFSASGDSGALVLDAALSDGRTIRKEFTLAKTGYMVNAKTSLGGPWNDPRVFASFHGVMNKTEPVFRQVRIWPFTMFMQDENNMYDELVFMGDGERVIRNGGGREKIKRVYAKDGGQRVQAKDSGEQGETFHGDLTWYSLKNKYFLLAAIPDDRGKWTANARFSRETSGRWYDFTLEKKASDGAVNLSLYMGPTAYRELKAYDHELTQAMDLSWKILRPLAIFFIWFFREIHRFIANWGIVLIIFSLFMKLVLYPLTKSSMDSMKKVSDLQPKINALREKYKNDPQKLQEETMALYKREKVNPFGGCLPMLLQFPVFIALYPVVGRAFELRQAMFVPHWIEDLSRPDPFYILPVAMGISMYIQSKDTMKDPNQKAMLYMMPVLMVILFANFSSGLTLYWFMFNVFTLAQTMIQKKLGKA